MVGVNVRTVQNYGGVIKYATTLPGTFDSIQLLRTARMMRDQGILLSGRKLTTSPRLFLGAAANPFAEPFEWRVHRLAKKISAGVDFIQTQCIYNMEKMREWIRQANDMGLTEKTYILAGVTPMKSLGMARYMKSKVPGMDVPDDVIKRLQGVDKKKQADEGIKIACEQIEEFKEMKGVAGVHLMAIEWEHKVPEIAERALSNEVITPGVTTTEDVVWWMRQRVHDLGFGSWFQPSVGLAGFMLKMVITPPSLSGQAEGAWTPPGATGPWLKSPPWVTTNFSRSVS